MPVKPLFIFLSLLSFQALSQENEWVKIAKIPKDSTIPDSFYFEPFFENEEMILGECTKGLGFGFYNPDSSLSLFSGPDDNWLRYPDASLEIWEPQTDYRIALISIHRSYGRGYEHSAWSGSSTEFFIIDLEKRDLLTRMEIESVYEEWTFQYDTTDTDSVDYDGPSSQTYTYHACELNIHLEKNLLGIFPARLENRPEFEEEIPEDYSFESCRWNFPLGVYSYDPEQGMVLIREMP